MEVRREPCLDKNQLAPPSILIPTTSFSSVGPHSGSAQDDYNQFYTYTNSLRHGEVNIGLNIGCPDHPIVTLLKIIFVFFLSYILA